MNTREKGFTLVELLVSVAIVGILASIALPAFSDYKKRAYDAAAISQIRDAIISVEAFFVDNTENEDDGTSATFYAIRPDGSGVVGSLPGFNHTIGVGIRIPSLASSTSVIPTYQIAVAHCKGSPLEHEYLNITTPYVFNSINGKIRKAGAGESTFTTLAVDGSDC